MNSNINSYIRDIVIFIGILFFGFAFGIYISNSHPNKHFNNYSKSDFSKCMKSELSMSPELVPYFESFIEDCKQHNINCDHVYCLDWIRFEHSNYEQGITDSYNKNILINENLLKDSVGMKFVLYHEIGHWLGLHHSNGMMKTSYNTKYDMEYVRDNWLELKNNYFAKLKGWQD